MDKCYEELEKAYQIISSNLYLHTEKCKGKHCFLIQPLQYVRDIEVNPQLLMTEIVEVLDKNYPLLEVFRGDDILVCIKMTDEQILDDIKENIRDYCLKSRIKED